MVTYSLKLFTKNCDQTAANGDMVSTDSLSDALFDGTVADPLRLTV